MSCTRLASSPVIVLALVWSIVFSVGHAVTYQAGLVPGDTALYSVTGPYSEGATETEMLVISVVGSQITVNFTETYGNGTRVPDTFYIDLATGDRNSTVPGQSFIFAVGTNLGPGDPLHNNSPNTISSQEAVECAGQRRETVYTPYREGSFLTHYNWDKNTGVLCLFRLDDEDTPATEDLRLSMMGTNLWTAESLFVRDLSFVAPVILVAAILVGVFLLVRRGRKRERG